MEIFRNDKLSIDWLEEVGVYHLKTAFGADMDIDTVNELRGFFKSRPDLKPAPVLFEAGDHSLGNTDVREHLSNGSRFFTADAFMVKDFGHRIVYKFYERMYRPQTPTAFFTDRQKALEWLKGYVHVDKS